MPGVVYGGGQEPLSFSVDERELRLALHGSGAVLDLSVDGGKAEPAVLKDSQRHPVRGDIMHVDLLRVDLTQAISAIVTVELIGAEDAPGVKSDGGILEHVTRELNIEALPSDIPEAIQVDVSAGELGDTITLASDPAAEALPGFQEMKPRVFAGLFLGIGLGALREFRRYLAARLAAARR